MPNSCNHTIHQAHSHYGWDNSFAPQLTIAPGESVEFETVDASGGQLGPESGLEDVVTLDFGKINPVTGPVLIDGAEPGDALKVTLLGFEPSGWGWTASIPGFGLLADQFPDPALNLWTYDAVSLAPALYGPGGRVPPKPFCVPLGVAPAAAGLETLADPGTVQQAQQGFAIPQQGNARSPNQQAIGKRIRAIQRVENPGVFASGKGVIVFLGENAVLGKTGLDRFGQIAIHVQIGLGHDATPRWRQRADEMRDFCKWRSDMAM